MKDDVLLAIKKLRGLSGEDVAALRGYANKVAIAESDNDPSSVQLSGGPGRGKYQYELSSNRLGSKGSGANKTAINRFKSFAKKHSIDLDENTKNLLSGSNVDFSGLPEDLQDAIFFADISEKPQFKMDDFLSGKTSAAEAWADSHWMGSKKERDKKLKYFNDKMMKVQMLVDFFEDPERAPDSNMIYNNQGILPSITRHF